MRKAGAALLLLLLGMFPLLGLAEPGVFELLGGLLPEPGGTVQLTVEEAEGERVDGLAGAQLLLRCASGEAMTLELTLPGTQEATTLKLTAEDVIWTAAGQPEHTLRWEVLAPQVSTSEEGWSIRLTGPEQELISLSVRQQPGALELNGGYISAGGSVYSLWDSFSCPTDETERFWSVTFDEDELLLEGSGVRQTAGDGGWQQEERLTVSLNEETLGSVLVRTTFTPAGASAVN